MVRWLMFNGGERYLSANPAKDLMDLLVEKTKALGHELAFKEVRDDSKMFHLYYYAEYFTSFEHAAHLAWEKVQQSTVSGSEIVKFSPIQPAMMRLLDSEIIISEDAATTKLQLPNHTTKKGVKDVGKSYGEQEIKRMLTDYYLRTGRLPTCDDAKSANGLPSYQTLLNTLGPKSGWLDIITRESTKPSPDPVEPAPKPAPPKGVPPATICFEVGGRQIKIDTDYIKEANLVKINLVVTAPGKEEPANICLTV